MNHIINKIANTNRDFLLYRMLTNEVLEFLLREHNNVYGHPHQILDLSKQFSAQCWPRRFVVHRKSLLVGLISAILGREFT
jgi:hypothetical protein